MELLTEDTVVAYLFEKGIFARDEEITVEVLTGGVSNTVLAISTASKNLVLKQALPALKVAELWEADPRRAIVEADALELFHSLNPEIVPKLVFVDPIRFVVIMERVSLTSRVWKSDLLEGIYRPQVARTLGATLSQWHNYGVSNPAAHKKFMEDTLFDQLRIDPFYRFVAAKNLELQDSIRSLIAELENNKSTIVHGDFSPKNFMVTDNDHVYVLDFEVMHVGNPVFDLAFILAHLLCKFFHAPNASEAAELSNIAKTFLDAYLEQSQISETLVLHTALIALARVEGKSPVNYLSKSEQEMIQLLTKKVLLDQKTEDAMTLFDVSKR
ncbi:MAG: aminoglycoside phosphotransferase family protein [Actinomycetes bacterium]